MTPSEHLEKAGRLLEGGWHLVAGGFTEAAAREAYLSALHAGLAYIVTRTGTAPKTHAGARSQFALLARDDGRIWPGFATFLGRAYEFKTVADYEGVSFPSKPDAESALRRAGEMVALVREILSV